MENKKIYCELPKHPPIMILDGGVSNGIEPNFALMRDVAPKYKEKTPPFLAWGNRKPFTNDNT